MFTALLLIVLSASTPTQPELRHGKVPSSYLAINPLRKAVVMDIVCLGDFTNIQLPMSAGTSLEVEIKKPDGEGASCYLASYVIVKQ